MGTSWKTNKNWDGERNLSNKQFFFLQTLTIWSLDMDVLWEYHEMLSNNMILIESIVPKIWDLLAISMLVSVCCT